MVLIQTPTKPTFRVLVGHAPACLPNSLIGASVINTFRSMSGSLRLPIPPAGWLRFPRLRVSKCLSTTVHNLTSILPSDISPQLTTHSDLLSAAKPLGRVASDKKPRHPLSWFHGRLFLPLVHVSTPLLRNHKQVRVLNPISRPPQHILPAESRRS